MSEHMFGVRRDGDYRRLTNAQVRQCDRICREEGGYGYTYIFCHGDGWIGWYSGPNRGYPLDDMMAARVERRVTAKEHAS